MLVSIRRGSLTFAWEKNTDRVVVSNTEGARPCNVNGYAILPGKKMTLPLECVAALFRAYLKDRPLTDTRGIPQRQVTL